VRTTPVSGKRYGNVSASISELMNDARESISEGNLCSILYVGTQTLHQETERYAWHWPADYIPNPDSVAKIGEFVT
jgi:hypothetical protein